MRTLLPFALAAALTGCVIYDEELVWDDGTPVGDDPADRDPADRPSPPSDDPATGFSVTPDRGQPGETLILFVDSEAGELGDVVGAEMFGPSDLIVTAVASGGASTFVVTVAIPDDAASGPNDLLLERADGTVEFLDDVFRVQ
ncbi:MAG: hypothetical protein H6737_27020 [Alphaproteobacteria bacterium]|nr:hypothetical protein [Alphaproteobacteria bacterium]